LRDLLQQKILSKLCSGGDPAIFLRSHVPMFLWKDFMTGQIKKIRKHKEERNRSGKLKKNKKERMEERKRRDFFDYYFG
jgi:hypothetical protein